MWALKKRVVFTGGEKCGKWRWTLETWIRQTERK